MKQIVVLVPLLVLFAIGTAFARPDYSELNQASTNYFKSLDEAVKLLPTVNTAQGTVELVNSWSLANENIRTAIDRFAKKNPEVLKQSEPPPEFKAFFDRFTRLKTDYAALPAGIGKLTRQFGADHDVGEALKRFQKSLQWLGAPLTPPK